MTIQSLTKITNTKGLMRYVSEKGNETYTYRFTQSGKRKLVTIAKTSEITEEMAIEIARKCNQILKNNECVETFIRSQRIDRDVSKRFTELSNKTDNRKIFIQFNDYELVWLIERLEEIVRKKGKHVNKSAILVEKMKATMK